jgi:hypothetical protein
MAKSWSASSSAPGRRAPRSWCGIMRSNKGPNRFLFPFSPGSITSYFARTAESGQIREGHVKRVTRMQVDANQPAAFVRRAARS